MKRYVFYALLLTAAVLAGCSESPTDAAAGTTGAANLKISGTRAQTDGGYDPLEHLLVKIYDGGDRLLRRYASREELPQRLELLGGDYRVAVAAGEQAAASFEKRYYVGTRTFRVEAGATTPVEVVCQRTNVAAKAVFEASVTDNFSQYTLWIAAGDAVDEAAIEGRVPALQYTADATGYFTLPEGVTTLAWKFEGEHKTRGPQSKSGILTGLEAGDNCSLGFRYSPDLPGFIEAFAITVDTETDNEDDTIVWTDISIEGDGFDMNRTQDHIPGKTGAKSYKIINTTPIGSVTLGIDDERYDLPADAPEGVAVSQQDERHMTLTVSDALFAGRPGGSHSLSIRVTDRKGGELERKTVYRLQGLLPVDEAACNLWSKSLTLQALVLDTDIEQVTFAIRSTQGEQSLQGIRGENGIFTAEFAPQWESGINDAGLTYYTATDTGIKPATEYTCTATVGSAVYRTTLQTPPGDPIYNAGMELWSTYFVTGSGITGGEVPYPNESSDRVFWVGGNNAQTNALCTGDTPEGSHGTCARLKPMVVAGIFAAGNLFTGTFDCGTGFLDMFGFARFGQQYTYTARPRALKLRYNATVTNVTNPGKSTLTADDIDSARIFVCITDWTERHAVKSGASFDDTTFWDPEKQNTVDEGAILGYGSLMLGKSTDGWKEDQLIPIRWYDKDTAPAAGNYSLVISCVTSYKGDYVAGSSDNVLYAEDFEWVY